MEITKDMERVFKPLLRQFCEETRPIGMDGNFSTVFLPHTMPDYHRVERKIFYFGRDTYGWAPTSQLMRAHDANDHMGYLAETSQWARRFGFLEYNRNKSSGFWTMAMRLHLRLKGITENLSIGANLPEGHYECINDFGWGNTNAIEVPQSLNNQGVWESLDKDKYWAVKQRSKRFDKLAHTINAFRPDLVFVFNWDCNEEEFLEGLNYQGRRMDLLGNHFLTYHLPDTDTRVIWTVHPSAARWLGYGTDSVIDEIIKHVDTL